MPDYTLLVVPKGTVLEATVKTEIGFDIEKEEHVPGVQAATDLLYQVKWDCYSLVSDEWVHDELDPAPTAPWSMMLWQYSNGQVGDDIFVYCRVRKGGEQGDVIFVGNEYGDVLLQTGPNFEVLDRALHSIRVCTRLVAAINADAVRLEEEARW